MCLCYEYSKELKSDTENRSKVPKDSDHKSLDENEPDNAVAIPADDNVIDDSDLIVVPLQVEPQQKDLTEAAQHPLIERVI